MEILSSQVIMCSGPWVIYILFAGFLITLTMFGLALYNLSPMKNSEEEANDFVSKGMIMFFITLLLTFLIGFINRVPDYTEYTVKLSNEINIEEFVNKYEILENDGLIFKVKEIK